MKTAIVAIIAFFCFFSNSAHAQFSAQETMQAYRQVSQANSQIEPAAAQDYSSAQVSVRLYDRAIYYPGNPQYNPINIQVNIKNTGSQTLRFKLANDRVFSTDIQAFTVRNTRLSHTEQIIQKRSTSQTVYFREIALETGEEYSFVENAKDFLNFNEPGLYYVELLFYPELYKSKAVELKSNRLALEIRPAPSAASSTIVPIRPESGEILRPQPISPDKVVEQTIIARQKSLWDQFFLYLDIEEMLKADTLRRRRYVASSAEDGEQMLADYKAALMSDRIDTDISAVPERFEIIRTNYTQTEGTVTVHEWFKYPNFSEKKEYIYQVRQRDGIWRIYGYYVNNLGTE